MSELLDFIKSTPESRIAEEVKAMAVAYGQAVAECERLKVENDRLKSELIDCQINIVGREKDAERWRKAKTLEGWRIARIISKHQNDGVDADAAIDAAKGE